MRKELMKVLDWAHELGFNNVFVREKMEGEKANELRFSLSFCSQKGTHTQQHYTNEDIVSVHDKSRNAQAFSFVFKVFRSVSVSIGF